MSRRRILCLAVVAGLFAAPVSFAADAGPASEIHVVLQNQVAIVRTIEEITRSMEVEGSTDHRVRTVLFSLTRNELLNAIRLLEKLAAERDPAAVRKVAGETVVLQARAIKIMQDVLGIIGMMEKQKAKTEGLPAQGVDMPTEDLQEKLDDLQKSLQEFLKEQNKVIESTNELAKMPMDDLTPDQEQQLKNLAATEDKWASFLKEKYTDISKTPVQDASVASMLKELVEIYSEVQLAKDALSKKAIEIATPAEEAGAELAKSLETNIEKWLPDYAERIKWQMEEPLQDYQVPMAELPKELEDLVGDLLEEEEDLMSDAEDASSSHADSMDKAAGWDALDGPIANMSAKGVTGNHLPNKSEIGGRSGEGRTGKSAGEFVEDKASGKGGRRTPTRLTPDPFESGVVDDQSQDSGGGATGGGKISGGGGEGLEGPVPPEVKQQMDALAGRQADLRNRAERIQLGFQVMNYPTDSISRTIRIMKGLEDDIRSGRYNNIARRRDVLLKNLSDTHLMARGEMQIQRDLNIGLPSELQDEIIDAQGEPTPEGYEELLKGYFQALSRSQ